MPHSMRFRANSVSIHAPARGATGFPCQPYSIAGFQSTLPRGERPPRVGMTGRIREVSIHAPARGATDEFGRVIDAGMFQSTLPRGERLSGDGLMYPLPVFQSTLPRGERPSAYERLSASTSFNPRSREGSDCLRLNYLNINTLFIQFCETPFTLKSPLLRFQKDNFICLINRYLICIANLRWFFARQIFAFIK